jgi:aryl-alcohol dehydrogenase-like predicted oxidoreductase
MKLALGTVQFGLDYGVSNRTGKVSAIEAGAILSGAMAAGISTLDTASGYGDSEDVIGSLPISRSFKVITKTPHLGRARLSLLTPSFMQSLKALGRTEVDGLLFHACNDLLGPEGQSYYNEMTVLKEEGRVKKIGLSVYDPEELETALRRFELDIVQLPLNVFSQKFHRSGWIKRLKGAGIEIHVRSPFLQGLALMPQQEVPAYFSPVLPQLNAFREQATVLGTSSQALALAYLRSIPEIDFILCGVQSAAQLQENLAAYGWQAPVVDFEPFSFSEEKFSNPSLWQVKA